MIGWRLWQVTRGGMLIAPFKGDVLPYEGVVTVECPMLHIGQLGISYWESAADAMTAVRIIGDENTAITAGVIGEPTMPDSRMPVYNIVGGIGAHDYVALPVGRRTAAYGVTAIYTDVPVIGYGVGVLPLSALT